MDRVSDRNAQVSLGTQTEMHRKEHVVPADVVRRRQEDAARHREAKELRRRNKFIRRRMEERAWAQRGARAAARASIALNMASMPPAPPPRPGAPRPAKMPLVQAGMRVIQGAEIEENAKARLREMGQTGRARTKMPSTSVRLD